MRSRRSSAASCRAELRGPPKVLQADGHSFSDVAAKVVSIINLASVAAIETMVGAPVHPLRFRANLYVDGWPAWREFGLLGQEIAIGNARLKITQADHPLRGDRGRPTLACATLPYPTRCCARSTMRIAGFTRA